MLPRKRVPDEISPAWADRLTAVHGDSSWRDLYSEASQGQPFGDPGIERVPGANGLLSIYIGRLSDLFRERYLDQSVSPYNSRGSLLYEFIFLCRASSGRQIGEECCRLHHQHEQRIGRVRPVVN